MQTIATESTMTGGKGYTVLYETAEEAIKHANHIGDTELFEHVVEYDDGYIVIRQDLLNGGIFVPVDYSKQGKTIH